MVSEWGDTRRDTRRRGLDLFREGDGGRAVYVRTNTEPGHGCVSLGVEH